MLETALHSASTSYAAVRSIKGFKPLSSNERSCFGLRPSKARAVRGLKARRTPRIVSTRAWAVWPPKSSGNCDVGRSSPTFYRRPRSATSRRISPDASAVSNLAARRDDRQPVGGFDAARRAPAPASFHLSLNPSASNRNLNRLRVAHLTGVALGLPRLDLVRVDKLPLGLLRENAPVSVGGRGLHVATNVPPGLTAIAA